jgi:hypothetical protein
MPGPKIPSIQQTDGRSVMSEMIANRSSVVLGLVRGSKAENDVDVK